MKWRFQLAKLKPRLSINDKELLLDLIEHRIFLLKSRIDSSEDPDALHIIEKLREKLEKM